MSVESENNRPNDYGFAGDATGPQPAPGRDPSNDGEDVAVPAGDLTGAVSDGLDDAAHGDDAEADRR